MSDGPRCIRCNKRIPKARIDAAKSRGREAIYDTDRCKNTANHQRQVARARERGLCTALCGRPVLKDGPAIVNGRFIANGRECTICAVCLAKRTARRKAVTA